ncbi:MAG: ribonuclease [Patescibacteria group bacterium]|nr:ribonuclease [Patescibacteria group bacterium]
MKYPSVTLELEVVAGGYPVVIGVDEAGRGCLAGPVIAAAVVFEWEDAMQKARRELKKLVRDSKLLPREVRREANELIRAHARAFAIGSSEADEIDRINILQATFVAMNQAVNRVKEQLPGEEMFILVDGNKTIPGAVGMQQAIIDGDAKIFTIAAASIIAKEYRDSLMEKVHQMYPMYNFAQHKGYGTLEHRQAIARYGLSPIHRKTFTVKQA